MKKRVIKIFDKIILLLLGFSGAFYSCAKYGMIVDEYHVNGTVMDKTGKPIKDILITGYFYKNYGDMLYTNSEGKFSVNGDEGMRLKFEDIDGEANGGEFETREINIEFTDADLVKRGRGNKTPDKYKKTVNIELDRLPSPKYGVKSANFKE